MHKNAVSLNAGKVEKFILDSYSDQYYPVPVPDKFQNLIDSFWPRVVYHSLSLLLITTKVEEENIQKII